LLKEIKSINKEISNLGFLDYKIIHKKETDSTYTIIYNLRKKIKNIKINIKDDNLLIEYIEKLDLTIIDKKITIPYNNIQSFLSGLVKYYEEKGFPFTKINLVNLTVANSYLISDINIKKSKPRKIDDIVIKGYNKFPKKFISKTLKLQNKKTFNNLLVSNINEITSSLPFISQIKKPQILFLKDSTLIYIYIKKKRINQINGLIGFSTNENSKIKFNGNLNLSLNNNFNNGESIKLDWRSSEDNSKKIDFLINVPFIFNSNISLRNNFSIYSQDSSFVNISNKTNISYYINHKNKIGAIFKTTKSTNLLKNNSENIQYYNSFFYGINYSFNKASNSVFYKDKLLLNLDLLYGKQKTKNLSRNKINLTSSYLFNINKRNSVFLKNNSSLSFSKELLENELERIGGETNLRGFNEDSIIASSYNVFNFEYNYHINKETSLYSISDFALTKNAILNTSNKLFGIGIGYKTKLKSSLLNVNYSIGMTENQTTNTKNGILNIKFTNIF